MFVEENIFAMLAEKRNITVCDSSPAEIIAQENMPVNPVLSRQDNERMTNKTVYRTGNDIKKEQI